MYKRAGLAISIVLIVVLLGALVKFHRTPAETDPYSSRVLDQIESRSRKALEDFPKDVPIYPGLRGTAVTNNHGIRTAMGQSQDKSEAVLAYYEDALSKNGWNKTKTDDDNTGFSWTKDGRQVYVGTLPRHGRFASTVDLTHTDADATPEARRAAAAPDMPEAREVLNRMAKVYAECASYRDTGQVKEDSFGSGSSWSDETPFSTVFVRPDRFRFEYRDRFSADEPWSIHIIHSDASGTRAWGDSCTPGVVSMKSLELAIGAYAGVSSGSSDMVPEMLLGDNDSLAASRLFQLKLLPSENLNGVACHRVAGLDNLGEEESLWIDQKTMLLRRVDEFNTFPDFQARTVTTYKPEVDVAISGKELDFAPPE